MSIKDDSIEKMNDLKQQISDFSNKIGGHMSSLGSHAKHYSSQGVEKTSATVSEHPLKSVGIAAACGFLIGYLFAKK